MVVGSGMRQGDRQNGTEEAGSEQAHERPILGRWVETGSGLDIPNSAAWSYIADFCRKALSSSIQATVCYLEKGE